MGKKEKPKELHWIDYCHKTLQDFVGLKGKEKEFEKGYKAARKRIKESLEREAKDKEAKKKAIDGMVFKRHT